MNNGSSTHIGVSVYRQVDCILNRKHLVIRNMDEEQVQAMGVRTWPTWDSGVKTFPCEYRHQTSCFILDGEATVTADGGSPITVTAGDFCVFRAGLRCTWDVTVPVIKHYKYEI